jgi:hypothetical protein
MVTEFFADTVYFSVLLGITAGLVAAIIVLVYLQIKHV